MTRAWLYDTGALIAADRGNSTMWRIHRLALASRVAPIVIAPVIAQAWRDGARQAMLSRLLNGCVLTDFPATAGFDVGRLLGRAGTADVVDAAVVMAAVEGRCGVVTSDPADLTKLAEALGVRLRLMPV